MQPARTLAAYAALAALPSAAAAQGAGELVEAEIVYSASEGGFGGQLDDGDRFGSAVATLGDLDGDGQVDLAVGAPGDDDGGRDRGAVHVLFLGGDGVALGSIKVSDTPIGVDLADQDAFGSAVARVGDLDGDGVVDLAAGAPGDDGAAEGEGGDRGAVHLVLLSPTGPVLGQVVLGDGAGGFPGPLDDGDAFGSGVAALGDLDGNGVVDLAVGAPGDDDGGADRGAVWILFLAPDLTVLAATKVSATAGGLVGSLADGDAFGAAVGSLGDLDGDGVVDLAVGAPGDDTGGADRGAVWILFLAADGSVQAEAKVADGVGGFAGALADGDAFGSAVAAIGDLDASLETELAVGAPGDDGGLGPGTDLGAAWVLFLDGSGAVAGQGRIGEGAGGLAADLDPGDRFAAAVGDLGDLEGNDVPDVAAGAPGGDDFGIDRGAAFSLLLTGATVVSNPGSGINPEILLPGPTLPALGAIWSPVVVDDDAGEGEPLFVFVGVSDTRFEAPPSEGKSTPPGIVGELLISLEPDDLILVATVGFGGSFQIPVPSLPGLVGTELFTQGGRLDPDGLVVLSNGLDLVIGLGG